MIFQFRDVFFPPTVVDIGLIPNVDEPLPVNQTAAIKAPRVALWDKGKIINRLTKVDAIVTDEKSQIHGVPL
jgi:hypothetical protein